MSKEWDNERINLEEMEKLVKELKEEIGSIPPNFYVTTHLPVEYKQRDEDGKVITDEDGKPLTEMIHCIGTEAGYWLSAEAADKLQELRKDAKKESNKES